MNDNEALFASCLKTMLRPVARFCIARGLRIQDAVECFKEVFVQVAEAEIAGRKVPKSLSRISVMTGLQRKDIGRLLQGKPRPQGNENMVTNVIGRWLADRRFRNESGLPKLLDVEGKNSEFAALVRSVSADLTPYTILHELERVGAVLKKNDKAQLITTSYTPRKDLEKGLAFMAEDVSDLMQAVSQNLEDTEQTPHLHLKTEYTRIPAARKEEIKRFFMDVGSELHARTRAFLAGFDLDLNQGATVVADLSQDTVRAALGTFSFIEEDGKHDR